MPHQPLREQLKAEAPELYADYVRSWEIAEKQWLPAIAVNHGSYNSHPHLWNIERYLDDLLGQHERLEMDERARLRLRPVEKYLLLAAILFHDIGRIRVSDGHARESAKIIRKQCADLGIPSQRLADSLADICEFHTPVEGTNESLRDTSVAPYGLIRTQAIAVLLRLGDYLDSAYSRVLPRFYVGKGEGDIIGAFRDRIPGIRVALKERMIVTQLAPNAMDGGSDKACDAVARDGGSDKALDAVARDRGSDKAWDAVASMVEPRAGAVREMVQAVAKRKDSEPEAERAWKTLVLGTETEAANGGQEKVPSEPSQCLAPGTAGNTPPEAAARLIREWLARLIREWLGPVGGDAEVASKLKECIPEETVLRKVIDDADVLRELKTQVVLDHLDRERKFVRGHGDNDRLMKQLNGFGVNGLANGVTTLLARRVYDKCRNGLAVRLVENEKVKGQCDVVLMYEEDEPMADREISGTTKGTTVLVYEKAEPSAAPKVWTPFSTKEADVKVLFPSAKTTKHVPHHVMRQIVFIQPKGNELPPEWDNAVMLCVIAGNVLENARALKTIERDLRVLGLPVDAWLLEHKEHLFTCAGRETYEPWLSKDFLLAAVKGMWHLSTRIFGAGYTSYETLAAYLREPDIERVKCAVRRIGIVTCSRATNPHGTQRAVEFSHGGWQWCLGKPANGCAEPAVPVHEVEAVIRDGLVKPHADL